MNAAIAYEWNGRWYTLDAPCRITPCLPDDIVRWSLYGLRWLSIAARHAIDAEKSAQVSRLAQQFSDYITRGKTEAGIFDQGAYWPDRAIGAVISAVRLAAAYAQAWGATDVADPHLPVDEATRSLADRWDRWWAETRTRMGEGASRWAWGPGLDAGLVLLVLAFFYFAARRSR